LLCSPKSAPPLSQLYTGFGGLARRGELVVSLEAAKPLSPSRGSLILRAVLDDTLRLVYDCIDGADVDENALAWCSTYFKRSYQSATHGAQEKIRPLGLNYGVYGPGDFRLRRMLWLVGDLRPANVRRLLGGVILLSRSLSTLDRANGGCSSSTIEAFERQPNVSSSPKIICFARTWDPSGTRGHEAEELRRLNETRARSIRALRNEFGPMFSGGLAPSPDAVRDFPDCVVDQAAVRKRAYLAEMHSSDICITTRGLRGSNGWRLAEYVAACRAIVTEHPWCDVPGDFADGTNYLGFDTVDQCVSNARRLFDNTDLRRSMMQANHAYYERYVRPDAFVSRSLEVALRL
jgi:hypothetical protein